MCLFKGLVSVVYKLTSNILVLLVLSVLLSMQWCNSCAVPFDEPASNLPELLSRPSWGGWPASGAASSAWAPSTSCWSSPRGSSTRRRPLRRAETEWRQVSRREGVSKWEASKRFYFNWVGQALLAKARYDNVYCLFFWNSVAICNCNLWQSF